MVILQYTSGSIRIDLQQGAIKALNTKIERLEKLLED